MESELRGLSAHTRKIAGEGGEISELTGLINGESSTGAGKLIKCYPQFLRCEPAVHKLQGGTRVTVLAKEGGLCPQPNFPAVGEALFVAVLLLFDH